MLENLVTRKMTVNSANSDHGYNEQDLFDMEALKNKCFHNTVLTKASKVFLDSRKDKKNKERSSKKI